MQRLQFYTLIVGAALACSATAQEIGFDTRLYVSSSVALVRTAPNATAPVAGRLVIGTQLTYLAVPANAKQLAQADAFCPHAEETDGAEWLCVQTPALDIDAVGWFWHGWVAREVVSLEAPQLDDLLARYDATATDAVAERRRWAERAAALDPTSAEAQRRLLEALDAAGDAKARAAAEQAFLTYRDPRPAPRADGVRHAFIFGGGTLDPLRDLNGRTIELPPFDPQNDAPLAHHHRNQIYSLYRRGQRVGAAVTENEFNCAAEPCAYQSLARSVPPVAADSVAIALDYDLPPRAATAFGDADRTVLLDMAHAWIAATPGPDTTRAGLRAAIDDGSARSALGRGQISADGRAVLFGSWRLGTKTTEHYDGKPYEALFVVAEQLADGTFRQAPGSGSLANRGCAYFDHVDLDADGTDEVVLVCEAAEDKDGYAVMRREGGVWVYR